MRPVLSLRLNCNQVIGNLVSGQHLGFPLMAGKDNNLARIGCYQPAKSGTETIVIIEDKAVVKDKRKRIIAGLD